MNAVPDNKRAIGQLEAAYLRNKCGQSYIACEDLDFIWTKEEVFDFECRWDDGASLKELARYFRRSQEEILILALDLGLKERIRPRQGGLMGN